MLQSLRLISLSNYVFVLEISQISGIVPNASMLITVVMRIVAVVGEKKRKGAGEDCPWNQALSGPNLLSKDKYFVPASFSQEFTWKMLLLSMKHSVHPPTFLPVQGCFYLWQTTKRSPLIFPPRASAASVSQHQGHKCLTWRYFLIFPPCEVPQQLLFPCLQVRTNLINCVSVTLHLPLPLLPVSSFFPHFLLSFPSLSTYHPSFSCYLFPSPSPTPGPTVIGIPSGSWDPYKHSRRGESEQGRVCVCVSERETWRQREKEKASKSIRWFIRALSHSGRCLVCLCLSNTLS